MGKQKTSTSRGMPIVYDIIFRKFVDRITDPQRMNSSLSFKELTEILSIVFHIPKKYHYNVIKEFEEYGVIEINRGSLKIIKKHLKI